MPQLRRGAARPLAAVALFAATLAPASGERLPITAYAADDGLGHDHLRCAHVDSRGLLWFCTANGLARFDGVGFVRFGAVDGLPSGRINDLLESPAGHFWVAADQGIYALDATRPALQDSPLFRPVAADGGIGGQPVNALARGSDGRLWAASDAGLLEIVAAASGADPRVSSAAGAGVLETLLAAPDGGLWLGGSRGLAYLDPDGAGAAIDLPGDPGSVRALLRDREGRLWIGADGGLWRLDPARAGGPAERIETFVGRRVRALLETSDALWVAAVGGIERLDPGAPDEPARRYTVANGLRDETANALVEDVAGNLWLATDLGGALRWVRAGLTTYDTPDGLGHTSVTDLFLGRDGALLAVGQIGGWISRFDGRRFAAVRPGLPPESLYRLERQPTHLAQGSDGVWWLATREGLYRFPATDTLGELARRAPDRRFGAGDGLPSDAVSFTFEDAGGALWAATARTPRGALARFDPARQRFVAWDVEAGAPSSGSAVASLTAAEGELWIGWDSGALTRVEGERLVTVASPTRKPVVDLLADRRGGLWIATVGDGFWHAPDRRAPELLWSRFGRAEGVASDDARCLVEDLGGRLYLGTVEGVDRLDPESGAIRHYGTADGLAQREVTVAARDRTGALWFGTYSGLSRLVPGPEAERPPPTAWFGALAIDDRPRPLPVTGVTDVGPLQLVPGRHRVRLELFAPSFVAGEAPRFQLRVDGGGWSTPSAERSVVLAALGSGRHEVAVRAVDRVGRTSPRPARLELRVLPPFWHRAWFFAAAAVAAGSLALAGHRLRMRRAVALERVRTRIAADLHDDLGASLARISLLAEVARTAPGSAVAASEVLAQIGSSARALTGRAREIVWSLDPRFDDLASFAVRVRESAGELLDPSGLVWTFAAPPESVARRVALRPELRQHLLLVFKEALYNAVRHARARRIELSLSLGGRSLVGEVRDDGRGFDPAEAAGSGQGLRNLRERLRAVGGEVAIDSAPGNGTRVRFVAPLAGGDRTKMRLRRPRPSDRSDRS